METNLKYNSYKFIQKKNINFIREKKIIQEKSKDETYDKDIYYANVIKHNKVQNSKKNIDASSMKRNVKY